MTMKYALIFYALFFYCMSSCGGSGPIKAPKSIVGTWMNLDSGQTLIFQKDGSASMLVKSKDTISFKYNYNSKAEPAHLDWIEFDDNTPLRGLNVFGIVAFSHKDTMLFNSKKGREGQAEKYRPTEFSSRKSVYIRQRSN